MSRKSERRQTELTVLYERFLGQQSQELQERCVAVNRDRARKLRRLQKRGVLTVADLLQQLPRLPASLKQFAIHLISILQIHQAAPVLLEMMSDRNVRTACAAAIGCLKSGRKVTQVFLKIARRELTADSPDRDWLEAVIHGLGSSDDPRAADVLVTIFERVDLPGWLRGDAADKLGCNQFIRDRRTRLFRRCHDTAIRGLDENSIDVQFWSLYLIGSLSSDAFRRRHSRPDDFSPALPRLRDIAANDHRLAPGYWWPLSAEAEDVIGCIEKGHWPDPEAAERWISNTKRGEWNRD
jgi:hypothetical protein